MNITKFLIPFFFINLTTFSSEKALKFHKVDKQKSPITIYEKKGIWFNKSGLKISSLVHMALEGKIRLKKIDKLFPKLAGSDHSLYCLALNGEPVKLITDKNNEEGFCQFSDGSMISAWDLYINRKNK